MRPKLCILIALIIACPVGYGLTLKEDIHVYGDGGMNARTDTNDAKDMASGSGDQSYHRVLDIQDDSTSLQSSYSYSKNASLKSNILNHYFALASSEGGPQHMVSVYSNSSIDSQSSIERNGNSLSTDYNISTRNGNLSESVTNSMNRGKSQFIAESNLQGHFDLSSKLLDKTAISRGFDLQDLSSNLDSVVDKGSRGVIEDRTPLAPVMLVGGKEAPPVDVNSSIQEGKDLLTEKKFDEAFKKFETATNSAPQNKFAWYYEGIALAQLQNNEDAFKAFEKALVLDPNYVDALISEGSILRNIGQYDESIKVFDKAINIAPTNENAHFARGEAYLLQGDKEGNNTKAIDDYTKAVNDFELATNIKPKDRQAWEEKGKALMKLGRTDEANDAFSKAKELKGVVA